MIPGTGKEKSTPRQRSARDFVIHLISGTMKEHVPGDIVAGEESLEGRYFRFETGPGRKGKRKRNSNSNRNDNKPTKSAYTQLAKPSRGHESLQIAVALYIVPSGRRLVGSRRT